jgi:hypothetical protein
VTDRAGFRRSGAWAVAIGLAAAGSALGQGAVRLELRGVAGSEVSGEVRSVGLGGLSVDAGGSVTVVGWEVLSRATGPGAELARAFAVDADRLWRARTRLERGDWAAAEPILEPLALSYVGQAGPTAAMVHEGLLRCRLSRGSRARAVWSWLDALAARAGQGNGGERWVGGSISGPAIVDPGTGLVPLLPPIYLSDAAADAAAGSSEWERLVAGGDVAELARAYRAALRFEVGLDPEFGGVSAGAGAGGVAGVGLVDEIVRARISDNPEERLAAREALRARLNAGPVEAWTEAWIRAGVGRSLLREGTAESTRAAVLELLHVPARFGRTSPELAALALAESAVALHATGDEQGAAAVRDELMRAYPASAATGWRGVRELPATKGGARAQPTP